MAPPPGSRRCSAIAASSDTAKGRSHFETCALLGTARPRSDLPKPERRFVCELPALSAETHPSDGDAVRGVCRKHARLFPGYLGGKRHLLARAIELFGRIGFSIRAPQRARLISREHPDERHCRYSYR